MARLSFVLFKCFARKGTVFSLMAAASTLTLAMAICLPKSGLAQAEPSHEAADAISPFCEVFKGQSSPSRNDLAAAIDRGGDLNQLCNMNGYLQLLPLNYLLSSDAALAQRLIEKGVNVNAQDSGGDTPLHHVGSSMENARSLIARGAQVNARNRHGTTPLHNQYGQYGSAQSVKIADLLIRNGADVNAQTNEGSTPLHYAIANPALAQRLLQAGADITLQNQEGAVIHVSGLTPAVLQLLIDQGADINLRNREGQTPLHRHRFDVPLVRLLLENGAQVNLQDNEGKTPLFDANIEVAKLLVTVDADLAIQDNQGRTALHQAVLEEQSFFGAELVSLFLQHSVDTQIKDNQGETALDIAQRLDKTEIVNLLEPGTTAQENPNSTDTTVAGVNIQPLQQQLAAKKWALADEETRRLLSSEVVTIPLDLIRAIDQAWLTASDGRFGLSVQAKLWQAAREAHPNDLEAAVNSFRDRVGWKLAAPRAENDFISSDWLNESELNYSGLAPIGHLPWAGVSDAAVQAVLAGAAEGCGSCTTDAMQLRNERFYIYLPQLFDRVQVALDTPAVSAQTWRSPQLLYNINLAALYPRRYPEGSPRATLQAISPDSKTLAVASHYSFRRSRDTALALWNLENGTRRITLLKPAQDANSAYEATAIAFSNSSQQIFAGLSNGRIQVWETAQGKSLRSWMAHSEGVRAIALSSDGKTIVSGGDSVLKVWDATTGKLLQTLRLTAGESQPTLQSVQISPDNQRLAVATNRTIQLWNLGTGQLLKVAVSTTAQNQATYGPSLPLSMAFSPDSRLLATLGTDNQIRMWNASNGARYITVPRQFTPVVQALAFSLDGKTFVSRYSDQSVVFWNLSTFLRDRSVSLSSGNAPIPVDTANAVATQQPIIFSPDGQTFAVPLTSPAFGQSAFGLDLRRVATGTRQTIIPGVESGSFSPDNRFLITRGNGEAALQVWQPLLNKDR